MDSEIEGSKEGRCERQRVCGGTDIVSKTGEGELFRTGAAANGFIPLEEKHRAPHPRKGYCRGEPIGAGADNDGIVLFPMTDPFLCHCRVSWGR